ncbi:MAG TPA: class I SAM-dependent methyltransferase [Thermoanaerobaculia bacterium]|nr:class I SAM-dependent methyltransferase [Thermoanaerobaculia bacterium]
MTSSIDPAGTRLLAAFRADVLHGAPLPCTAIHPDDFMLRFFRERRHGHWEAAFVDYFRTGLAASRAVERLLDWWFGERRRQVPGDQVPRDQVPRDQVRLLDFASGYGRITRHLVQHCSPRRLWVSDVFAEAVEFQRRAFGVHGFVSAAEPGALACAETFDCIVASSLFSHLPEESFSPWLRRLFALLRPGGMLLASVHDLSLRSLLGLAPASPRAAAGEGTILFEPDSEIPELGGQRYGTTWVDEAFMRRAVAAATGGAACVRLPRALSSFQDYYAIGVAAPDGAPPQVAEPVGALEWAVRSPDGRELTLRGWAHDLHGPGLAAVEVRVDGTLAARCAAEDLRADVAARFGEPDLRAGWSTTVSAPAGGTLGGEAMISIQAVSTSGLAHLIHLGSLEGTELGLQLEWQSGLRRQAEAQAAAEIDRMRASRFWKLRDAWWALKGALGLGRP